MTKTTVRVRGRDLTPEDLSDKETLATQIEPWLGTLFASEHLSVLLGSGFSIGVASLADVNGAGMEFAIPDLKHSDAVEKHATESAERMGRGGPNIEDFVRATLELIAGLTILGDDLAGPWQEALDEEMNKFLGEVLAAEAGVAKAIDSEIGGDLRAALIGFLLSLTARPPSRDRVSVFTTNYDRFIERGCDLAGLRILDRFVGSINPVFRSSRVDIDLHYSPPGIRGEPRYVDGVLRLSKLHGSLDWFSTNQGIARRPIRFGASADEYKKVSEPSSQVIIYPQPAKDVETSEYPYSELMRDFSAAVCRPNSTLVVHGYGFGDDHLNRVIADMLSIPSTHLLVISFDDPGGRIERWRNAINRDSQISLLIGEEFGAIDRLVSDYLPNPPVSMLEIGTHRREQNRGRAATVEGAAGANDADK